MANANKVQFPFDQGITYWQSSPEVKKHNCYKRFCKSSFNLFFVYAMSNISLFSLYFRSLSLSLVLTFKACVTFQNFISYKSHRSLNLSNISGAWKNCTVYIIFLLICGARRGLSVDHQSNSS